VELVRVVQEALNNVRKHARATNIWVQVSALDGGVDVSIRDNGSGFAATQDFEGHFGLEIMGERAESVGGRLTITSMLGEGTEVRIWVPGRELERELSQVDRSGLGER
jgi:signal transduction histidine kinase